MDIIEAQRKTQDTSIQQARLLESLKKHMKGSTSSLIVENREFAKLLSEGKKLSLAAKTAIYQEGVPADTIYYIQNGLAKQLIYLPNGKQKIININHSGTLFGLESLLENCYNFNAFTISKTNLVAIPKSSFINLKESEPLYYCQILEHVFSMLQNSEKWNAEFSSGSIKARVARIICYIIMLDESKSDITLISGEDMASMIGATIESVSRVLAGFKRSGILITNIIENELRFKYDLDTLLLYTTDDKNLLKEHATKKEQRESRRSYVNTEADIYIDDLYVDTATIRDYSQKGVFLDFSNNLQISDCNNVTVRLRKSHHKKLGKVVKGKVIRKNKSGIGIEISKVIP